MDVIGKIIAYELGDLTDDEIVEFFQHLIDTEEINVLQGHYQRTAARLIKDGLCTSH